MIKNAMICKPFLHKMWLTYRESKGFIMHMYNIIKLMTVTALVGGAGLAHAKTLPQPVVNPVTESAPNLYKAEAPMRILTKGQYSVQLNKTEIVRLPEAASAVVIGNPSIADVSVHSSDTLFIVGRGFGATNLIILNARGETIMNADVNVVNSTTSNNVQVFHGGSNMRATFNCSPHCQPSPILGDSTDFIDKNSSQADQISNTFAGGSPFSSSQVIGMANPQSESGIGEFQGKMRQERELE